jgi:hypothetical protein
MHVLSLIRHLIPYVKILPEQDPGMSKLYFFHLKILYWKKSFFPKTFYR